jgi:putative ABC transport system permease protein
VAVSGNFFPLLGVQPILGRSFTTEEIQPNGPRVVILSHAFWARHFSGDPTVIGRTLSLNERPITIVGVLPASFDFAGMFAPGNRVDLFVPYPSDCRAAGELGAAGAVSSLELSGR